MSERVAIERQWLSIWIGTLQSLSQSDKSQAINEVIRDFEAIERSPSLSTLTQPGVVVERSDLYLLVERLKEAENASRADARVVCHEAIQEAIRQVSRLREREANGIALTAENAALASSYKWEWKSPDKPPKAGQFVVAMVKPLGMEPQRRIMTFNHSKGAWVGLEDGREIEVLAWIELPDRPTELS